MVYLLFPGRHLANTKFQEDYISKILQIPIKDLKTTKKIHKIKGKIDKIIFAITSCNQQNSRYNPIPFHVRAISVDRFANKIKEKLNINYHIVGIPHYQDTKRFAEYTLKEIKEQTEGKLTLTPKNTIVLCSTLFIINLYQKLGFEIITAELQSIHTKKYKHATPIDVIKKIGLLKKNWQNDKFIKKNLSPSTASVWTDFPEIPERIQRLYKDPLLNDQGSLTDTRDYSTYAFSMGNEKILRLKYNDIKQAIVEGKIVDEGCADASLLVEISEDFQDSDLIGIEITGEFMARCRERQRAGNFGGTYIYFHQRNLMDPIFQSNSINTTICNSTLHELWSYCQQKTTVMKYLKEKYKQTMQGGRLIVRDVVGPENKNQRVHLWCNEKDGLNKNVLKKFSTPKQLEKHLNKLSTHAKFIRFTQDFLADMRKLKKRGTNSKIKYKEEKIDGKKYFVLSLKDASEFMSKKDYTDNWKSELNEEFSFWSFSEWKKTLSKIGFKVIENPNEPTKSSRAYCNPWSIKNSFNGKVKLFKKDRGKLKKLNFPVTNMVLIGEKTNQS